MRSPTPESADRSLPPLAAWRRVRDEPELLLQAAQIDATTPGDVTAIARLRTRWPAELVAAALALAEGRRRAAGKFADASRLMCDGRAAQQASSSTCAAWKARRFAQVIAEGGGSIEDLCCGMGGDAMSLVRAGATVAVDRSEVRAWMAGENAGCAARVADLRAHVVAAPFLHIDPARRDEGSARRTNDPEAYEPPLALVLDLAAAARGAALKLGPGIALPVPGAPADAEVEFLSEHGTLVQAVLWTGELAAQRGKRSATMLPSGATRAGIPVKPAASEVPRFGRFLFVPDPALERAELLGDLAAEFGLRERSPGLGILTADADAPTPWLARYEIVDRPRARLPEVRDALRSAGARGARVRTRGRAIDADEWTKALRNEEARDEGASGDEADVFVYRCGDVLEAVIARRAV